MEILDLLHPQDILVRESAQAKRPLLEAVARRLASGTRLSFVSVLSALLARKKLGATCIGQGIGMPHAMPGGLGGPAAVLAVLAHPIPYDTSDEQCVDVVLGVVWPRKGCTEFLNSLARFCRHLSHPQVLKKVSGAVSAEEVRQHLGEPKDAGCPSVSALPAVATPRAFAMHGRSQQQGGLGDERNCDGSALTLAGRSDVRSGSGGCARM